jgi:uncharacterized protein YgiM (DUF1202 family)
MRKRNLLTIISLLTIVVLSACNLPTVEETEEEPQDIVATWAAATLTAQAASVPNPTSTPVPEENSTPTPTATESLPTATPQNPLVLETTLCWVGPGAQYDVVSALKKDERVELIGQGSISGWWIVDNPIYHDPCWAQAKDLQIEPGYNTSALQVYYPPPTPTFTPTETTTPTPTNTP